MQFAQGDGAMRRPLEPCCMMTPPFVSPLVKMPAWKPLAAGRAPGALQRGSDSALTRSARPASHSDLRQKRPCIPLRRRAAACLPKSWRRKDGVFDPERHAPWKQPPLLLDILQRFEKSVPYKLQIVKNKTDILRISRKT